MKVVGGGPDVREFRSVLAQLRHLYMLMQHEDLVTPNMDAILSRQIKRLESLDRVLFKEQVEWGRAAEGAAMSEWQPIATAPKDGTHVLAAAYRGSQQWASPTVIAWNVWQGCWADHPAPPEMKPVRRVITEPTHWMPLPDPPGVKA